MSQKDLLTLLAGWLSAITFILTFLALIGLTRL